MSTDLFKPAQKATSFLKCAVCGPAGSGKTLSSLKLATGLGSKLAVIDTERGSSNLYAHLYDFQVAELNPPYTPAKYVLLIHKAVQAGFDVLIIDSLSHAWVGAGGVLDMHHNAAQAQKNSYTAWRTVTPEHDLLVHTIINTPIHIICTMRAKMAYEQIEEAGRKKIVKLGLAPVQREGMDYEFTIVWDLDTQHIATTSKARILDEHETPLWPPERAELLSADHGLELKDWLLKS